MKKTILKAILSAIVFITTTLLIGYALISWPSSTPVGGVNGGLFASHFNKLFISCPDGKVSRGYDTSKNIICVDMVATPPIVRCGIDKYKSGASCIDVGRGYYSPTNNDTRIACTNTKPSYSLYTSDGNGINNCAWGCSSGYTKSGSSCVKVTVIVPPTSKCGIDKYKSGASCIDVGRGYYSPANNDTRTACTTQPSTGTYYTSSGGGIDNCSWTCRSGQAIGDVCGCPVDYGMGPGFCTPVGIGSYSPNIDTKKYSCDNKPTNSSYTGKGSGSNNCPWVCNSGYTQSGSSCVWSSNNCTFNGKQLANNQTASVYLASKRINCSKIKATITCNNGIISPSSVNSKLYRFNSCSYGSPATVSLSIFAGKDREVARAYSLLFGRYPDPAGFEYRKTKRDGSRTHLMDWVKGAAGGYDLKACMAKGMCK